MTLGSDPEALTLGYLCNQKLVTNLNDILFVQVDWEVNSVAVTTNRGNGPDVERLAQRTVTTGSGQGTMFGAVFNELAALHLPADLTLSAECLHAVMDSARDRQRPIAKPVLCTRAP